MAKGKSSATALKRITHQISLEVSAWRQHRRYGRFTVGAAEELPPLYQMAALRGEGLLLSRFFVSVQPSLLAGSYSSCKHGVHLV